MKFNVSLDASELNELLNLTKHSPSLHQKLAKTKLESHEDVSEFNVKGMVDFLLLIETLKSEKRTGWVRKGVPNPESIADHMHRMAIIAMLFEQDRRDLDVSKCVMIAAVHDLAEAIVGDITPHDPKFSVKHDLEKVLYCLFFQQDAILLMNNLVGTRFQLIKELYFEYEEGRTSESQFVKQIDKLEMLLQAFSYKESKYGVSIL
ncbi:hypothetical protein ROZALSC1DRAFT_27731 [Rozella allomycis CSF55]|uniref:5'-deoxynucleotidase n=1 Tax=Rozella allomycis (strain CSF55) TaxID=988480 RepID=A0A075AXF2_ROZAC|nr:HD domain-containing protein [Rozella allomycis CSF55]RKP20817.1 hypothetical protein ROZALSC1DRAFT_27731 [Rozella allomycis CSF55]|eukprot:EPZ33402.1 HD domain-containing protein [Rozella allomycis CSF55]